MQLYEHTRGCVKPPILQIAAPTKQKETGSNNKLRLRKLYHEGTQKLHSYHHATRDIVRRLALCCELVCRKRWTGTPRHNSSGRSSVGSLKAAHSKPMMSGYRTTVSDLVVITVAPCPEYTKAIYFYTKLLHFFIFRRVCHPMSGSVGRLVGCSSCSVQRLIPIGSVAAQLGMVPGWHKRDSNFETRQHY